MYKTKTTKYILTSDVDGVLCVWKEDANLFLEEGEWMCSVPGTYLAGPGSTYYPTIEEFTGLANWDIEPGTKYKVAVKKEIYTNAVRLKE